MSATHICTVSCNSVMVTMSSATMSLITRRTVNIWFATSLCNVIHIRMGFKLSWSCNCMYSVIQTAPWSWVAIKSLEQTSWFWRLCNKVRTELQALWWYRAFCSRNNERAQKKRQMNVTQLSFLAASLLMTTFRYVQQNFTFGVICP